LTAEKNAGSKKIVFGVRKNHNRLRRGAQQFGQCLPGSLGLRIYPWGITVALQLAPDQGTVCYNLGLLFHMRGDIEQAVAFYKQMIGGPAPVADAYHNLGQLSSNRNRFLMVDPKFKTTFPVF
jgi:hypothetical protein